MNWTFYEKQTTDPIRNPISAEFFSTEAVGNVAEAFIREAIQNTLDARIRDASGAQLLAKVRIFLSEGTGALPSSSTAKWFDSLWQHVQAPKNGLRDQPEPADSCPFLVFEDFGTTGLTGRPDEHQTIDGVTNNFLNFFRAEGHSDKGEQDRGSWGVGKTVFPRASRISSFFGLTVRNDDHKRLLLGRSILKYHKVEDKPFKSDGYFGIRCEDGFMLPCDDLATLNAFKTDFGIKRDSEPGLSIVVPWYDMDSNDGVTREKVIQAVLGGFFYPILMGHLAVTIATAAGEITLDCDSLVGEVKALANALSPMVDLAIWAKTRIDTEFQSLLAPAKERAQKLTPELVSESVIQTIRQAFESRERVAIRARMFVQPKEVGPIATYFNVFLERSEQDSAKPLFIRDELIIPDVKSPRISQVRALIIVENKPLSNLLRDAETPAHTQWNPTTSNFKNKYKFGPGAIDYVRLAVSELLRIVNQAEQSADPSITIDFFSIPAPLEEEDDAIPARRQKLKDLPGDKSKPIVQPIPQRPKRFRIDKLRGGFSIRPGDPGATLPPGLDIRVAYDVRRGNPLKKFHAADFDISQMPIHLSDQLKGIEVKSADGNRMFVAVQSPDFLLNVTGFDPNRDLYVKVQVREEENAD